MFYEIGYIKYQSLVLLFLSSVGDTDTICMYIGAQHTHDLDIDTN